ncbi:helix-turn-helix domain-containing protein (plasmid) [Streptomyces sp. NBC_01724]|uniref:helix-turn-helix domain-containing protein n=1 Tax=Streptomyces sp. NBC_01724 TaxID=2975922 RepID=UPI002E323B69|nr:helix-turn-helix transcriptional regulator [Streptomyces sp. NBC_01724]
MTDDQQRTFGQRVKEFRKAANRNRQDSTARLGKSASWVSWVERGLIPVRKLGILRDLTDRPDMVCTNSNRPCWRLDPGTADAYLSRGRHC